MIGSRRGPSQRNGKSKCRFYEKCGVLSNRRPLALDASAPVLNLSTDAESSRATPVAIPLPIDVKSTPSQPNLSTPCTPHDTLPPPPRPIIPTSTPPPFFPGGKRGNGPGFFAEEFTPESSFVDPPTRPSLEEGEESFGYPESLLELSREYSAGDEGRFENDSTRDLMGRGSSERDDISLSLSTSQEWEIIQSGGPSSQTRSTTKKLVRKQRRSSRPASPPPEMPAMEQEPVATTAAGGGPTRKLFKKPQLGQGWALLRLPSGGATSKNGATVEQ